jgi:uncharacterized protein
MSSDSSLAAFEKLASHSAKSPTLIEGLPGLGLVAAIAVDQITSQLELKRYGTIRCADLPSVVSFEDGRVRDLVRVYAGADPAVMTLQSDLAIRGHSRDSVTECVLHELAATFDRAIFLAGAPAENEEQIGEVTGIATTDAIEADLQSAGITLAEGNGIIGGITGALLNECYQQDIPAAGLIVRAHPYLPDPSAARAVIEQALEPLVEFDIETIELVEQADQIQQQLQQIAQQYQETQQAEEQVQPPTGPSMYQ